MAWFCFESESEYECGCYSILLRLHTYTSRTFLLALAKLKLMNILLLQVRFFLVFVLKVRTFNKMYTGYAMSYSYSKFVKSYAYTCVIVPMEFGHRWQSTLWLVLNDTWTTLISNEYNSTITSNKRETRKTNYTWAKTSVCRICTRWQAHRSNV